MYNPFKAFKNYIAGEALKNSPDEFETAGINLVVNYAILGLTITTIFSVFLFVQHFVVFAAINAVTILLMLTVFVLLKKTNNMRKAGRLYTIIQQAASTVWGVVLNFSIAPEQVFWLMLNVLVAFFVVGRRWGYVIASCGILHIGFGMINESSGYAYLHLDLGPAPTGSVIALLVPFILNIYILREFVRTRSVAENEIKESRQKNEELLLNILPYETAQELKLLGHANAKFFDEATVLFADIKSFSKLAAHIPPEELVELLHDYFKAFDEIISKHHIEKIKTIGDAYLCASGLPVSGGEHALIMVKVAKDILLVIENLNSEPGRKHRLEFRLGIHSGPLVAGVVGIKKFAYDIWGDTVNIAARLQQNGEAGKINISQRTYELVKSEFNCEYRGKIEAKNKGEIDMYFVV